MKQKVVPHKPKKGNSLAEARPDIAAEWSSNGNGDMTPFDLSRGSAFVAYWKCAKCGHEYSCSVAARTAGGRGCPECGKINVLAARRRARITTEQFAERVTGVNPDIEVIGDFNGYRNKVMVRCRRCGHEWDAYPNNLMAGHGCIYCRNRNRDNS